VQWNPLPESNAIVDERKERKSYFYRLTPLKVRLGVSDFLNTTSLLCIFVYILAPKLKVMTARCNNEAFHVFGIKLHDNLEAFSSFP
jgi:hypothetical protein